MELTMRASLLIGAAAITLAATGQCFADFPIGPETKVLAAPVTSCTFVLGAPFDFSGQFTQIPIPNNETAELCVITKVATATSSGGTGRCLLNVTVDTSGTKHWTMQMPGPAAGYAQCEGVCVKAIQCK